MVPYGPQDKNNESLGLDMNNTSLVRQRVDNYGHKVIFIDKKRPIYLTFKLLKLKIEFIGGSRKDLKALDPKIGPLLIVIIRKITRFGKNR